MPFAGVSEFTDAIWLVGATRKIDSPAAISESLATLAALLNRWTRDRAVGAKDAAIAGFGLEPSAAALAVIKELASIRRHRFNGYVAAGRASDSGFVLH